MVFITERWSEQIEENPEKTKFEIRCPRCKWTFDLDADKHVKSDIDPYDQYCSGKDLVCPACQFKQVLSYGY